MHLLSSLVASTYLLVGLAKVEFGDHQRFTLLWALSAGHRVMLVSMLVLESFLWLGAHHEHRYPKHSLCLYAGRRL